MNRDKVKKYLKESGLWAKKSMGQNFLVDDGVLEKIVNVAELEPNDVVLEIGPGLGVLTQKLSQKTKRVVAIEKDQKLADLLKKKENNEFKNRTQIINADVLDLNIKEIISSPYKLVANIPYYITGKVFKKFLESDNKPSLIVMLIQKEVAERIVAKPGKMSLLSASVQAFGDPEIIQVVKAESFFPAPKVDSAIIKIKNIKDKINKTDQKSFFKCLKIGFSAKRKTLENNLAAGYRLEKRQLSDILKKIGIPEKIRAQELTLKEWHELSSLIE